MKQINNLLKGITHENPIIYSLLGLCPALAITTKLENAIGMGIAFTFVLIMSNTVISIIRKIIPNDLRIPVYIVIIATFVTIIEMLLNAFLPNISKSLGIFLPLIVVNCIVLGRAEAFASKNNIISSIIDGLGMGIGYSLVLCFIAVIREVLGTGKITIWNNLVININSLFNNEQLPLFSSFFISSAGGFIILGLFISLINHIKRGKMDGNI